MNRNLTMTVILVLGSLAGCSKPQQPATTAPAQSQQQPAAPVATAPPAAQAAPAPAPSTASAPVPATLQSAATAPVTTESRPATPVQQARPMVIPAGTTISVRLGQALGSKTSTTGQSFSASVARAVNAGGKIAVPISSSATGSVVAAKAKGRIQGAGELDLTLTALTIRGRTYPIITSVSQQTVKGKGKRSAIATGGAAAGGALLGGIFGGGKGAAIGAGVGGGAGLAGGTFTGNQQIELPAETVVSFQLKQSLTLR